LIFDCLTIDIVLLFGTMTIESRPQLSDTQLQSYLIYPLANKIRRKVKLNIADQVPVENLKGDLGFVEYLRSRGFDLNEVRIVITSLARAQEEVLDSEVEIQGRRYHPNHRSTVGEIRCRTDEELLQFKSRYGRGIGPKTLAVLRVLFR
jgi:hypothetical protein